MEKLPTSIEFLEQEEIFQIPSFLIIYWKNENPWVSGPPETRGVFYEIRLIGKAATLRGRITVWIGAGE